MAVATSQTGLFGDRDTDGYGRVCSIWTARSSYSGRLPRLSVECRGDGESPLCPSVALADFGESGYCAWHRLRALYIEELNRFLEQRPAVWRDVLRMRSVVLCCSCRQPDRCLRVTLAMILTAASHELGLPAWYCGETH